MKTVMNRKFPGTRSTLGLTVLALIASSTAVAAEGDWYGGVALGRTYESVNFDKVFQSTLPAGFALTSYDDGDHDTGYKVFAGYQFHDYLALEGGYFDLGDFNYRATTNPAGNLVGGLGADGWNLDLVGELPLTQNLSALARFGFSYADTRSSMYSSSGVPLGPVVFNERNGNYKYGVGLQYELTPALALRVEAERFRLDEASGSKGDVDMFSLGLVYRFGDAAPVAVAPTPAPAAVAAAPRPTPAPAPAPTPPPPARVSFEADALFDFNSAVIKPAGMAELDKFAADLRNVEFDVVEVTGHTDRLGTQDYNLRLSAQRADAVKDYLVKAANIAATRVNARGINGSDPVTTMAQCGANLPRAQLIVCLAPDRRVEVEVMGTRR